VLLDKQTAWEIIIFCFLFYTWVLIYYLIKETNDDFRNAALILGVIGFLFFIFILFGIDQVRG
jgi:uncharacterized membrane protein